jgi:hypothetical protein
MVCRNCNAILGEKVEWRPIVRLCAWSGTPDLGHEKLGHVTKWGSTPLLKHRVFANKCLSSEASARKFPPIIHSICALNYSPSYLLYQDYHTMLKPS